MDFVSALINVLAIIGIIIAGAFVVVFLGDLFLSIIDGNSGLFFKKKSNKEKEAEFEKFNNNLENNKEQEEIKLLNDAYVDKNQEEVKILNNVDEKEAERERALLFAEEPETFNNGDLLVEENKEEETKKLLEEVNRKYLEEQALKERNYEDEEFEFESLFGDEEEEPVEEPVQEEPTPVQTTVIEDDQVDFTEDRAALLAEMERIKNELEEEKKLITDMRQSLQDGSDKLAMIDEINQIKQNIQKERQELEILRDLRNKNFIYYAQPQVVTTTVQPTPVKVEEPVVEPEKVEPVEEPVVEKEPEVDYKAQLEYINSILAKKEEEINKLKEENSAKDEIIRENENKEPQVIIKEVPVEVKSEPEQPIINNTTVITLEGKTEEEYKQKLADLEEKLRLNEREFRAAKKEFIPLRKVKKALENDEVKLRRREAIVAKQKIMLYGVNNMAEIDEEKAQKLAEDLDLLDGLRLSVQHCKEVMEENKNRYPVLERNYTILKQNNEEIRSQIEEVEGMIAKFHEDENVESVTTETTVEQPAESEAPVENQTTETKNQPDANEVNATIEEIKNEEQPANN